MIGSASTNCKNKQPKKAKALVCNLLYSVRVCYGQDAPYSEDQPSCTMLERCKIACNQWLVSQQSVYDLMSRALPLYGCGRITPGSIWFRIHCKVKVKMSMHAASSWYHHGVVLNLWQGTVII